MCPLKSKQGLTNLYQLSTTNLIQVELRKTGSVKDYNTSKRSFSAIASLNLFLAMEIIFNKIGIIVNNQIFLAIISF
jgi:hypothetical protein